MNAPKVGETTKDETLRGRRDAFHVPGVLVSSQKSLRAGASVRFTSGDCQFVETCSDAERHAVVDPFVESISPGELVWVFLIPSLASDLRHMFVIDVETIAPVRVEDDEDDDNCAGCYGYQEDENDEDDEDNDNDCKGCYL